MSDNLADAVFLILIFLAVIITIGDPDILDGLIKMANS